MNLKPIEGYVLLNFEAANISSFRENQNQPFGGLLVWTFCDLCLTSKFAAEKNGVAVDNVGMDIPIKLGDSRSNGFRGIR